MEMDTYYVCGNRNKNQRLVHKLTVFDSSLPDSIIRRQRGIISVVKRKLITSGSSV